MIRGITVGHPAGLYVGRSDIGLNLVDLEEYSCRLGRWCRYSGQQPLQPSQVLLIVAAEIVHETAQRYRASLEDCCSRELLRSQTGDQFKRLAAGMTECSEGLAGIASRIGAFLGKRLAVYRGKHRVGILQGASQTFVIAVNFDIPDMPDLFDG